MSRANEAAVCFRRSSCPDLTGAIRGSLDLMLAIPAGECLQFKIIAADRMRRAPGHAHEIFAFRAGGGVGDAKATGHGVFLFAHMTKLLPGLAFQSGRQLIRESGQTR
jgi:hypothetical protein